MTAPTPPVWVTVPEIAAVLSVSHMTVYRWVKSGKLPAVRFGPRMIRVRNADVAAFVRRGLTGDTA